MRKTIFTIFTIFTAMSFLGQDISASFERNNEGFYTFASGDLEVDHENSTDEFAVGNKSMELFVLNNGSGNLQFLCKKFVVTAGESYSVKFQIKSNQERKIKGKSQFALENKKVKVVMVNPAIQIGKEWKTVEFTVDVPADFNGVAPKLMNVGFIETKISNAKGLSYFIDDFQIQAIQ